MKNVVVHVYQATKYLTMGGDAEVIAIEDIGTVALLPDEDSDHEVTLQNVTIIGVPLLDSHKGRVEPLTPPFGRCSRGECCW